MIDRGLPWPRLISLVMVLGFGTTTLWASPVIHAIHNPANAQPLRGSLSSSHARAVQQATLVSSDGLAGDRFGYSVAVSGSTAVVGAYAKNGYTGAAYIFTLSGTTWTQQTELVASDAAVDDYFGLSVAISGTTVLVGAYGKNSYTGAVYVFVSSGATWTQQAKLASSDGTANDYFGYSVAISGSTALVGAPGKKVAAGAVYAFARQGTTWSRNLKLTAGDAFDSDYFGHSVALSGSTALIGAQGKNSYAGAAYIFVHSGTAWSQQAELIASDAAQFDGFGYSAAISGTNVVIGARCKNSCAGAAYIFAGSGTTWSQQAELVAADASPFDVFGYSVSIDGSTVLVGAPQKNSKGAVYEFTGSGTTWTQSAELTASDAAAGDIFGAAAAVSVPTAVFGAPRRSTETGAAYVFAGLP